MEMGQALACPIFVLRNDPSAEAAIYQPSEEAKVSGATIDASDSMMNSSSVSALEVFCHQERRELKVLFGRAPRKAGLREIRTN